MFIQTPSLTAVLLLSSTNLWSRSSVTGWQRSSEYMNMVMVRQWGSEPAVHVLQACGVLCHSLSPSRRYGDLLCEFAPHVCVLAGWVAALPVWVIRRTMHQASSMYWILLKANTGTQGLVFLTPESEMSVRRKKEIASDSRRAVVGLTLMLNNNYWVWLQSLVCHSFISWLVPPGDYFAPNTFQGNMKDGLSQSCVPRHVTIETRPACAASHRRGSL